MISDQPTLFSTTDHDPISYHGRLGATVLGHFIAAIVAVWEHANGRSIAGNLAWAVFVVLMYVTAYMLVSDRDRVIRERDQLLLRERAEFLSTIKALNDDLQRECENLSDCPQLILDYEMDAWHKGFVVRNRNKDAEDATEIMLHPVRSQNYTLTSKMIPILAHGFGGHALDLHVEHNTNGMSEEGDEAWKVFAYDSLLDTTQSDLRIDLHVTYKDLSGRLFDSPSTVKWSPLLGSVEVSPRTIKRQARP